MITKSVIERTFQFKCGNGIGTCFAIDVDSRQYLCTATHCLSGFNKKTVELLRNNEWETLEVELVGIDSKGADICVLSPKTQLSPPSPLLASFSDVIFGQDVYFLGFPFGIEIDVGKINRFYPLPFVKKAMISAILFEEPQALLLDGHGNPGFSGGPVVFQKQLRNEFFVASIVSGYRAELEPILDKNGKETSLKYHANTGIIFSYSIDYALNIIRNNPIGFKIKE